MDPPYPRRHSRVPRSAHFSRQSFDTRSFDTRSFDTRSLDGHWDEMSSRPKSMSDFQSLLDASPSLHGQGPTRKKPSISLAQGLMMTSESPRSYSTTDEPPRARSSSQAGPWSENLFYAYAQKVNIAVPIPRFLLAFCFSKRDGPANGTYRAISRNPHPTSSPLPLLALPTNGGLSFSANTPNLHALALSSSSSRETTCRNKFKTIRNSTTCATRGSTLLASPPLLPYLCRTTTETLSLRQRHQSLRSRKRKRKWNQSQTRSQVSISRPSRQHWTG